MKYLTPLFVVGIFFSFPLVAQAQIITPTFGCVANIPCTSPLPTTAGVSPTIYSTTPVVPTTTEPANPSVTLNPCESGQASIQHHKHKKHKKHHHNKKGFLSKFIEWLLKLIESLLKQFDGQTPPVTPNPELEPNPTETPDPCETITPTIETPTTEPTGAAPSVTQAVPTTAPAVTLGITATLPPSTTGLKFFDEFNGPADSLPDTTKWKAEVGAKMRNNEDQYYTPFSNKNAFMDGAGSLVIEARRENYNGSSFTSAALDSTYSQAYGRIEWRAKMDSMQSGVWPALWTWGESGGWPQGGELDMMEWFANPSNPTAEANIHASDSSTDRPWGGQPLSGIDITQWNIYSVEWRPTFIEFKVNGTRKAYIASGSWKQGWSSAFTTPQMIIMNIAMNNGGVSWMGSNAKLQANFTKARMYVDYVRFYE